MSPRAFVTSTRRHDFSHAAVVARGMGRPCVSGAGAISVDYGAQTLTASGHTVRAGEIITLDGATGEVFIGAVAMIEPSLSGDFGTLMTWADEVRRMGVRTNAETPLDAETARKFGAEGIGLSRTEHMFFDPARIGAVRQMIMASDTAGRKAALEKLLPFQRQDFADLFRIMAGLPVTIRLLDPPLHEFRFRPISRVCSTPRSTIPIPSSFSSIRRRIAPSRARCPRVAI